MVLPRHQRGLAVGTVQLSHRRCRKLRPTLGPNAILVTIALIQLSAGLIWAAVRQFDSRPAYPLVTFAALFVWSIACAFPIVVESGVLHTVIGSSMVSAYLLISAWEIWRDGDERLFARWPIIVLLTIHGLIFGGSVIDVALIGGQPNDDPTFGTLFSLIHFEHFLFTAGTAIFLTAMVKERNELVHKTAAKLDSLTVLANRGAFLADGEIVLEQFRRKGGNIAVLVFDIDHFKSINDKWGHAAGDRILKLFGSIARRCVRPEDLVGRLGGEEFAVIMKGADHEVGRAFARRFARRRGAIPMTELRSRSALVFPPSKPARRRSPC